MPIATVSWCAWLLDERNLRMTKSQERQRVNTGKYWFGSDAANRELDRDARRRQTAAEGTCPDCGESMTIDEQCPVSDPPHESENVRLARAALCGTCETCIEL